MHPRACLAFRSCSPFTISLLIEVTLSFTAPGVSKFTYARCALVVLRRIRACFKPKVCLGEASYFSVYLRLRTTALLRYYCMQVSGEYLGKSFTLSRTPFELSQPLLFLLGSSHAGRAVLQPCCAGRGIPLLRA